MRTDEWVRIQRSELPSGVIVSDSIEPYAPDSITIDPMFSRLKSLVLAAALTVMPLHSVAAILSPLLCNGDAQSHVMHSSVAHDHGAHQDDRHGHDGTGNGPEFHPCFSTVSATLPAALVLTAASTYPDRVFAPDTEYDPFIPEQPHRPPLV